MSDTENKFKNWEDIERRTKDAYGISYGELLKRFNAVEGRLKALEDAQKKDPPCNTWPRGGQYGH